MSLLSPTKSWADFNSTLFFRMLLAPSSLKLVSALGSMEKSVGGSTTGSVFSADKTEEEDPSFWSHKPARASLAAHQNGLARKPCCRPPSLQARELVSSLRANRSFLICRSPGNVMAVSFGWGKRKNMVH